MASVVRCDKCGLICDVKNSFELRVYMQEPWMAREKIDLCTACTKQIIAMCTINRRKHEEEEKASK